MNNPRRLLHITSPGIAIKVAKTGIFLTAKAGGDRGVNAYLLLGNDLAPQKYSNPAETGAEITFEWEGNVIQANGTGVVKPDLLYDGLPWRQFIPAGSTKFLYLVDIRLQQNYKWPSRRDTGVFCVERFVKRINSSRTLISVQINPDAP